MVKLYERTLDPMVDLGCLDLDELEFSITFADGHTLIVRIDELLEELEYATADNPDADPIWGMPAEVLHTPEGDVPSFPSMPLSPPETDAGDPATHSEPELSNENQGLHRGPVTKDTPRPVKRGPGKKGKGKGPRG